VPRRRLLAALAAPLVATPAASAQSRGESAVRTRPTGTARFRLDAPEKDWRLLPGGVDTLASLAHKDGAVAIVIEHELLQIALTADEIDGNFADLEVGAIRERESAGTGFTGRVAPVGPRRMVIVDYQRRATAGSEQVRVFVLLQGRHLYRLVCVAPAAQFARYAAVFQAVCSSFTALDAPA
jgi:hypothetical protein